MWNFREKDNDEKLEKLEVVNPGLRTADKLNNAATILIFIITFINVILNAFDIAKASVPVKDT